MKHLLFTLCLTLILGPRAHAATQQATSQIDIVTAGSSFPLTATAVYALNNVLTGTSSSIIDVGANPGMSVSISGTSLVDVYWNNTNASQAGIQTPSYTLAPGQTTYLAKQGRYVYFRSQPQQTAGRRVTVWYILANNASGTSTISGTVTANQGTAGSAPWPVADTYTASLLTDLNDLVDSLGSDVNILASGYNYKATSATVSNTDYPISLTWAAQTGAYNSYGAQVGIQGPCSGMYARVTNSNTAPVGYTVYISASNTARFDDAYTSSVLHLLRAGSSDCTAQIDILYK